MIFEPTDKNTVEEYEKGIQRGDDVGFKCLEDIFSIKKSSTLYVMGAPFSGKSEFIMEMLVNLSVFYGYKHCIYTPETGNGREVFAELAAKYIRKDYYDTYNNQMTLNEMYEAREWINKHFTIIDMNDSITPVQFFEYVDEVEEKVGHKFDTVLIDPWNELKHAKGKKRDDEYLDDVLKMVRQNATKHKRLNIISTHCRDQQARFANGITYYPMPTARDYAGGQVWFRKGMSMIAVWRPPEGLECEGITNYEKGKPYEPNATIIAVQKAKPKGVAKAGQLNKQAVIFYDVKKHRYYEQQGTSTRYADQSREVDMERHTDEPF